MKDQLGSKLTQLIIPKVRENFETEKQKILSRFVDKFYIDEHNQAANGREEDEKYEEEVLTDIYNNSIEGGKLSRRETYWIID